MPVTYPELPRPRAVFDGRCVVEDVDALLDWLRRTPEPEADLRGCTDLHTALAQLLLAASVRITQPPADRILAACLNSEAGASESGASESGANKHHSAAAMAIAVPIAQDGAAPAPVVVAMKPKRRTKTSRMTR